MKNTFKKSVSNMWFNVQKMSIEDRKYTINYIINLNKINCGFIEYRAKFFMAQLIQDSECYFNETGATTKVEEFEKLEWYNSEDKLCYNKVMS